MTLTQQRAEEVIDRVYSLAPGMAGTARVTATDFPESIQGRKTKFVFLDMIREGLLYKVEGQTYQLTEKGLRKPRIGFKTPAALERRPANIKERFPDKVREVLDLQAELAAANRYVPPKRKEWWQDSIKSKPIAEKLPENYQILSDEELNFKAPDWGKSNDIPFDEALANFKKNFEESPSQTIHDIGTMVLSQRERILQQDRFIREMHAAIRHMDRIIRDYVQRTPRV